MNELYGQKYFEHYNFNSNIVNYITSNEVREYFNNLASKIVDEFNPKTVLDCGCATGYLVSALRYLGVEAFGIDVSKYAISNVEPKIKTFCFNQSIAKELPQDLPDRVDLVVCNQVLDCMSYEDVLSALKNMSQLSNNILIGESDVFCNGNVESYIKFREYFVGILAQNSMFRNINNDLIFDDWHLTLYCRSENVVEIIKGYEKDITLTKSQNEKLVHENNVLEDKVVNYSQECVFLTKIADRYDELEKANESLRGKLIYYDGMVNSLLWKSLSPLRNFYGNIKKKLKWR